MDLGVLACPRCSGRLEPSGRTLRCAGCREEYPVREGIPDLLPWSDGSPGQEWDRWREKLDRLQAWRRGTWDGSSTAGTRQKLADDLAQEFFRFARVPEGARVLEIGCGSGDLRRFLPGRHYFGLDPMPLPGHGRGAAPEPVFLRGVGERLPIAEASFDAVLLCETIDHALDPARVLAESRRVLRAGGLLAMMQSVTVEAPPVPLTTRLRVAAGRVKASALGRRSPSDAETKMHVFTAEALEALAGTMLLVDVALTRGQTLFLRAIKQDR